MRYGNYLPQHLYIRYRIHWNKVINLYEQSAPWPDPKARDKNWNPEKTSTELYSRDKRETLDSWSFLLVEPPFNFLFNTYTTVPHRKQTFKRADFATCCNNSRRRQWHPTPVLLPGKSHGQRSLVGRSPWGREESDTTERLHFHFSLSCIGEGNSNPLPCSCLENPRDRGAWWAAVYGVAQSQTQLKGLSSSSSSVHVCMC